MGIDWKEAPELPPESESGDESAPKRRGRPPGSRNRAPGERRPGRPRASLKDAIGGMLAMLNLPVQMFDPVDALDIAEMEALAEALDNQCKVSPTFRRYMERALGVASGGELIAVCGMILSRRMARHGFFGTAGEQVDALMGQNLERMSGKESEMPQYQSPVTESETNANNGNQPSAPAVGATSIS